MVVHAKLDTFTICVQVLGQELENSRIVIGLARLFGGEYRIWFQSLRVEELQLA